jgi:hypothetical protein
VTDDLVTLYCPPGSENASIAVGLHSYFAYREFGDAGAWLVRVHPEAVPHLCDNGAGFWRKD